MFKAAYHFDEESKTYPFNGNINLARNYFLGYIRNDAKAKLAC
jgi:hypothetical protein